MYNHDLIRETTSAKGNPKYYTTSFSVTPSLEETLLSLERLSVYHDVPDAQLMLPLISPAFAFRKGLLEHYYLPMAQGVTTPLCKISQFIDLNARNLLTRCIREH